MRDGRERDFLECFFPCCNPRSGLMLRLLVPQWYSPTCLCNGTDLFPASGIPQGKQPVHNLEAGTEIPASSLIVCGSATQGL